MPNPPRKAVGQPGYMNPLEPIRNPKFDAAPRLPAIADTKDHTNELMERLKYLRGEIQRCAAPADSAKCAQLWKEYTDVIRSPEIRIVRDKQRDLQNNLLAAALGAEFGLGTAGPVGLLGAGAKSAWDQIKKKTNDYLYKF